VAQSLSNLGNVLYDQRKFAEAEAMYREALAMRKKLLGSENPQVADSLNNLGNVLYDQGKFVEAEATHRQALAMRKQLLRSEHPKIANSLYSLACALQGEGKFAEAEATFREALAMREKMPGSENPDVAATLVDLVRTLLSEEKFAAAESLARQMLALYEKQAPDGWETFYGRSLLGGSLIGQKKYNDAEPLLLSGYRGMKEREERIPAGCKGTFKDALQSLVQFYNATGRPEEAARWKRELAARGF
jgi:tetratricopeptide (TPR) repeat protein